VIVINKNAHSFLSGQLNSLPDFLHSIEIKNICFDSREVQQGDCYIALPSVAENEALYIEQAVMSGAKLVICSNQVEQNLTESTIKVADVMAFSGGLLHKEFGSVTQRLQLVGVTGTNGKSSICYYLAQVLEALNTPSAVMGTLGYGKWNNLHVSGMTTLPLEKLHTVLKQLSIDNQLVAMEVSSHGLEQNRLAGVEFETAIFSNLTRDHLDYHGTMEAYGNEKAKLFTRDKLTVAIVNLDDVFAEHLINITTAQNVMTYGTAEKADVRFKINSVNEKGMDVVFFWQQQTEAVQLPLYGEFNAYNVAAVVAYGLSKQFKFHDILTACCGLKPVLGRMQKIIGSSDDPLVLVDYAHTPDALEQVLTSVKNHNKGKIILVVGCGGDRDKGKRPLMGSIAVNNATHVIFTSDNPRKELPEKICDDMTRNLSTAFEVELDREQAIKKAIAKAMPNDLVVIAGKGHEDYQEIDGQRYYFSDAAVAKAAMHMESLV
jgi:UDP-N-acetylmuramoyl-L-alanyl-D-glutamate--2,6-diaminopimelate ligase